MVDSAKSHFQELPLEYGIAVHPKNITKTSKFFDDLVDLPAITFVAGPEQREHLPARQAWGYLTVFVRVFVSDNTDPEALLEVILAELEKYIDLNENFKYSVLIDGQEVQKQTTDVLVTNITTSEGLLYPRAVGELSVTVQYQKTPYF